MTDETESKETDVVEFEDNKAKQLVDQLRTGKKLHDAYAKKFRSIYQISGKLLKEWRDHFKVKMPQDLNPRLCLEVGSKLMDLHQEATDLKRDAEARASAQRNVYQSEFREAFSNLVEEYKDVNKRLPSKDTLTALAENQVSDLYDSLAHTEIEINFFKEVLSDLANCRKIIENATVNLSVEAKALAHEKYLDKLNSNGGQYYG